VYLGVFECIGVYWRCICVYLGCVEGMFGLYLVCIWMYLYVSGVHWGVFGMFLVCIWMY